MDIAFAISAFVTLFVIIDPIGLAPLFVAMTAGMPARVRRAIAVRATVIAALLLTVFTLLGEAVLAFVGSSMSAFQIAGGILLFLTALDMLFERRTKRREDQAGGEHPEVVEDHADISVFPLATPLIGGPGAIATMILLAGQVEGDILGTLTVILVMVVVVSLVLIMFLSAGMIERALGKTGVNVVTRLLGMLLAALSVQFVLDGLAGSGVLPL